MIKTVKQGGRGKAVPSYLLSGVNIKRMVAEELSRHQETRNVGESNIVKIGKKPIFKIHIRQKEQNSVENTLPSKSFKIRSFTKKMRDQSDANKIDESCEIFEKVEYVRNLRAINNRIEIFNLSRLSQIERGKKLNESVGVTANIYSKMRELFKRDSSIKCKIGSQILVKQICDFKQPPSPIRININLQFKTLKTQAYRQMANKIQVHFNPSFREQGKTTLLIVSVESLMVHKKRLLKSSLLNHQESFSRACQRNIGQWNHQTLQLVKMISLKSSQNHIKIAFKVQDQTSLNEFKRIMDNFQLNYFCIFFPITKFVEHWNLYMIDALSRQVKEVVLLQSRQKLQTQFPILNKTTKSLIVGTYFDSFLTLSRTIQALFIFLTEGKYKKDTSSSQSELQTLKTVEIGQTQDKHQTYTNGTQPQENLSDDEKKPEKSAESKTRCQFKVQKENLYINTDELKAYFDFVLENRELKNQKQKKHVSTKHRNNSNEGKRRVLGQRQTNIQEFHVVDITIETDEKNKYGSVRQGLDEIHENLLDNFKQTTAFSTNTNTKSSYCYKTSRSCEIFDPNDLEEIMSHLSGSSLKTKPLNQHISDLVRKNSHIQKQISQFYDSKKHITLLSKEDIKKDKQPSKIDDSLEQIEINQIYSSKLFFQINKIT